jgi:hypothetical protein
MKIGVKTLVLGAILVIGFKNFKKDSIKNATWTTLLGLTVTNVLLAYLW